MYSYPLGPVSSWKSQTLAAMVRGAEGFLRAGKLALAFAAQDSELGAVLVAVVVLVMFGARKVNLCDPGAKEGFWF